MADDTVPPKPENPPLFFEAVSQYGTPSTFFPDVTLRDLFAAAALTNLARHPQPMHRHAEGPEEIADAAFAIADAMLARRSRG